MRWMVSAACVVVAVSAAVSARTHKDVEGGARKRYAAVAFDYFVLCNPDSVVSAVDRVFPGKGRAFTDLWRTRQFQYSWLRSITGRYVDFWVITDDALFYAANAMLNRFNQPVEELGLRPDRTVTDLNGLLDFALNSSPASLRH